MPPAYTRLTININDETRAALEKIRGRHGTSYTEIIRRAVAVYDLIRDETGDGHTVQIMNGGGVREIVLLG